MRRRTGAFDREGGQSLAELALVLPIMLLLTAAVLDLGRVYQSWVTLQSATRNAAEYAASTETSQGAAQTSARRVVCLETAGVPGFVAGPTPETCSSPSVAVEQFSVDYTAAFAPIATARIRTVMAFQPFFPYPFVTTAGSLTLNITETYEVAQVP